MSRLRLLTANLWNGRALPEAFAAIIREHEPDIVLAQEISPEQARVLERLLPHGSLRPNRDKSGMALAARWPVNVGRIAMPHRDALTTRLELTASNATLAPVSVEIINVHLSAPTRFHRFAMRRAQLQALRAHFASSPLPRVLAGDLNSLPQMPAYRALRRDLEDAALGHGRPPSPTWSPRANGTRLFRIDHVLVRGLRVLEFQVLRIAGSDHSALLATLAS